MKNVLLTQRVTINTERRERYDAADQRWTSLLQSVRAIPFLVPNQLQNPVTLVRLIKPAALILTGGNDLTGLRGATTAAPERDRLEERLIEICFAKRIPILGVCRGMQLLVRKFGGRVSRVDGHVRTLHPIHIQSGIRMPLGTNRKVNSFHNFGIRAADIPKTFRVAAVADDGSVEAMEHRTRKIWAMMWHPERPPHSSANKTLLRRFLSTR